MTTFTTQDRQDAQRTPLTDEKIDEIYGIAMQGGGKGYEQVRKFARAIEAAHGIGE